MPKNYVSLLQQCRDHVSNKAYIAARRLVDKRIHHPVPDEVKSVNADDKSGPLILGNKHMFHKCFRDLRLSAVTANTLTPQRGIRAVKFLKFSFVQQFLFLNSD